MSAETTNGDNAAYQARHARDDRHTMATTVQPRWAKPAPGKHDPDTYLKSWNTRSTADRQETLDDIERSDPDGHHRAQPTAADYKEHKDWAVSKHGKQAWNDYKRGGWAPQPEV